MKRILIFILISLSAAQGAIALEIVYPKKNPCVINASSTFFIGSVKPNESLKINDIDVRVSEIGAFAQMVPLNFGKNEFRFETIVQVDNSSTIQPFNHSTFIIERPQPKTNEWVVPTLIEYPMLGDFFTKSDNVPLRMTPVDSGINRMAHLPKDLQLLINGEKGGFYRVYLNPKTYGWISTKDVEQKQAEASQLLPVKLFGYSVDEDKDFCIYKFDLARKVPFSVKEENGLTLQFFNVKSENKTLCIEDNTFVFNVPVSKLIGYKAYYEGEKFVLKIRKMPKIHMEKPLKHITIVVDAGHGGVEYGAVGGCGDKEKDINLAISKYLREELDKRGAKLVMTRSEDVAISLADRVKIADEKDAMLLLSVHANAIADGSDPNQNRGTSVYYYHNQAKQLAECILTSMTEQLGTQNDKVRQGSLALTRPTSSVSVLIEVAYIINPDDYALLMDKDFQKRCAKAIADGIESYILQK